MRAPRPVGFTFLAVCALLCACAMAALLADSASGPFPGEQRLAFAATGALALVTAEALAFTRPWAFRASVAFAAAFMAMMVSSADVGVDGAALWGGALLFIAVALGIVHRGLTPVAPPVRVRRGAP